MKRRSNNQKGVTLTELMVVLAIIAVGSAIAVPTYVSYLPLLKIRAATRGLISDLRLTRQLAVSVNKQHRISFASTTVYEIQRDESSSQNWSSTKTVKTVDMIGPYNKIYWNAPGSVHLGTDNGIYFLPNGGLDITENVVTFNDPVILRLNHSGEPDYRDINVNLAGRVWTE